MTRTFDAGKYLPVAFVGCITLTLCLLCVVARKTSFEEQKKYEPRFFNPKSKPDTWLWKYEVHSYFVWDEEVGRYREVTKEKYDQEPIEKQR